MDPRERLRVPTRAVGCPDLARHAPEAVIATYLHLEESRVRSKSEPDKQALLAFAIQRGHFTVSQLLLSYGACFNLRNPYGQTPLILASVSGHLDIIGLLVDAGADVNGEDDDGFTPIFYATRQGHEFAVKLLLEKGADPDAGPRRRAFPSSPLLQAVDQNHIAIATLLLEGGAKPEGRSKLEYVVLAESARRNKDMFELLCKAGAGFKHVKDNENDSEDETQALGG